MRLDQFLCQFGLVKSRTKAANLILSGCVSVNGAVVTKPAHDMSDVMAGIGECEDDKSKISEIIKITDDCTFVGRGGIKLECAIERFGVDVSGKICADIGASTGGFTDCLLRHGAAHVYAIDSGHGQLDSSLRLDPRVTNIEGCNARNLDESTLGEKCSLAVCDVSFISQTLIIPAVRKILTDDGCYLSLIKPQFECGRGALSKNGVVKDKKEHINAVRRVVSCIRENGMNPQKIMKSVIKGGKGNTEFLLLSSSQRPESDFTTITDSDIREAVDEQLK